MNAKTVPGEVAEYLDRLRSAARRLPRRERHELVEAITEHVMTGSEQAASSAAVRNMLEDLGEPDELVDAAAPPGDSPRSGLHEIAAVALLLVGAFVVPGIGWLVGVVLLWSSPAWTRAQKWLGTFVLPGGLAAPCSIGCSVPWRRSAPTGHIRISLAAPTGSVSAPLSLPSPPGSTSW